ncbi:MAG: DJ-1/PfpI family protein, partial [Streptosporangiaceae bacterium]|nr:DJ-1/PfpI family protein [Streptosporangiaceae bacterium]
MASELSGLRVAFITANEGVEQVELTAPWQAVKDADGVPELLAPEAGPVQAFNHLDKADTFTAHRSIRDADYLDYDALVIPGGVANPDRLRTVPAAVTFIQRLFETAKPAAVICHGPWMLVE